MIVLWSGGCDSTLALYDVARKRLKGEELDDSGRLLAISINHDQVGHTSVEAEYRELIKTEFKKRELPVQFETVTHTSTVGAVQGSGLVLPYVWLLSILPYADSYRKETIITGYHDGDQFWKFSHEIKKITKHTARMLHRKIQIEHPLEFYKKSQIIRNLKDRGLYEMCWYCQDPTNEKIACGKCSSCITHKIAQKFLEEEKTETVETKAGQWSLNSKFPSLKDPKSSDDLYDRTTADPFKSYLMKESGS